MKNNNDQKVQRTHDNFYANEDRSAKPKEYFKWLAELTSKNLDLQGGAKMLDIGCAGGDFIYFFRQNFPQVKTYGVDVLDNLVKVTAGKNPESDITKDNINSADFKLPEKFDAVYMSGVHSIFDDPKNWVANFAALLNNGGKGFVFGMFNPFPYDVLLQIRKHGETGNFETGWNVFSKETIAAEFKKHNCNIEFIKWSVPIEISQNEQDLLRSWTVPTKSGDNLVTNAARIIHDFYCAVVTPPKL